jgi:hypothetical protein
MCRVGEVAFGVGDGVAAVERTVEGAVETSGGDVGNAVMDELVSPCG